MKFRPVVFVFWLIVAMTCGVIGWAEFGWIGGFGASFLMVYAARPSRDDGPWLWQREAE